MKVQHTVFFSCRWQSKGMCWSRKSLIQMNNNNADSILKLSSTSTNRKKRSCKWSLSCGLRINVYSQHAVKSSTPWRAQSPTISHTMLFSCKDINKATHSHARCFKMVANRATKHATLLTHCCLQDSAVHSWWSHRMQNGLWADIG